MFTKQNHYIIFHLIKVSLQHLSAYYLVHTNLLIYAYTKWNVPSYTYMPLHLSNMLNNIRFFTISWGLWPTWRSSTRWPHILYITSFTCWEADLWILAHLHTHSSALLTVVHSSRAPRLFVRDHSALIMTQRWSSVPVVLGECDFKTHTHTYGRARSLAHKHMHRSLFIDVSVWSHGCLYSLFLVLLRSLYGLYFIIKWLEIN